MDDSRRSKSSRRKEKASRESSARHKNPILRMEDHYHRKEYDERKKRRTVQKGVRRKDKPYKSEYTFDESTFDEHTQCGFTYKEFVEDKHVYQRHDTKEIEEHVRKNLSRYLRYRHLC